MAAMLKKAKKLEYPENPRWFSWKAWPNKYRLYDETNYSGFQGDINLV